ncbi:NAD(P)/FAD-dependent oxidoreductase [Devosia sp. A449]
MATDYDLLIIGGGLIGCAAAWGAARAGARVAIVDGEDGAYRASVGNFGLLWTQGKGVDAPAYANWTRKAVKLWPEFAEALGAVSGVDIGFEQKGGLHFLLSEAEAEKRMAQLAPPGSPKDDFAVEFIAASTLRETMPELGPDVYGATFCKQDGAVNPLLLLQALRIALHKSGVTMLSGKSVDQIRPDGSGFAVSVGDRQLRAGRLLLAAGLGSRELGRDIGLDLAVFPQRGQLMITARTTPFLHMPTTAIRQMAEGTVLLGSTQENVGFDKSIGVGQLGQIAERVVRIFPRIADLDLVRSWSCLRVMTPDGLPIYQQSERYPGAFAATAHSGVTLAGIHALMLAPAILSGQLPQDVEAFAADRFGDWQSHTGGSSH